MPDNQAPEQQTQNPAPAPDTSPEGQAQQAVNFALKNPASVPAKFKNEDGTVNGDALLQSYLSMEQRMGGGNPQPEAQPEATPEEALADPAEETGEEPNSLADALNDPEAPKGKELWDKVETELNSDGKISEATLAGLRENGVPETLIAMAQEGRKAKAQSDMQAAYESVGGKEEFDTTMQWAKENLPAEERKAIAEGLKGPQALYVLQGLHARALRETTGSGQINTGASASPTLPTGANANVKPFGSFQEQQAALKDPRYISNENGFRDQVDMRIMAGAGHDPRNLRVG